MSEKLSYRSFRAAPKDFKESNGKRTLRVCFSSETPVLRSEKGKKYWEVLSHDPGDADISLLQNGGALIDEHVWDRQFGSVEKAWIDSDRKGRADLCFADTALADERWDLMSTGHRKDISFGYVHTRMLSETKGADGIPIRRFAWKAYEITSTAIGADHGSTGVGRSQKIEISSRNETRNFMSNEQSLHSKIIERQRAITHDFPHLEEEVKQITADAILNDKTVKEYGRSVMELISKNPAKPKGYADGIDMEIGMSQREIGQYSFARALRNAAENGGQLKDCEEADYSQQVENTSGQKSSGFFVPSDVVLRGSRRDFLKRDLYVGDFGSGGAAVNTEMPMSMIELLRNRVGASRLGCTFLGGLKGPILMPRQTSPAAAQYLSEIAPLAASQLVLDQITLKPHRVGGSTIFSKQLCFQSTPGIEQVIQNDLITVIALSHDQMLVAGTGGNDQPLGIINTPGVNAVAFGGAPTFASVVAFETALGRNNADLGNMGYLTTTNTKGIWKTTAVALQGATTVSSRALWEDGNFDDGSNDGKANGYRAAATNQVPADLCVFGRWSELIYAQWAGFDIVMDQYTRAANAEWVLTINSWMDAGLRHGQSFTVSSDSGAQ